MTTTGTARRIDHDAYAAATKVGQMVAACGYTWAEWRALPQQGKDKVMLAAERGDEFTPTGPWLDDDAYRAERFAALQVAARTGR